MEIKQKKREEIEEKYKWDLTYLCKSDEEFLKELDALENSIKDVVSFKGSIMNTSKSLLDYLKWSSDIERSIDRIYSYAMLKHSQDTTVAKYQGYYGKATKLYSKYGGMESFVNPEMLEVEYSVVEKFYKKDNRLLEYKRQLEEVYRYKEHILSENDEKIISSFQNLLSAPEKTYEALVDSDMKFGFIKDEDNNKVEFNESNYYKFIISSDRRVRRAAFKLLYKNYAKYNTTIAKTYESSIEAASVSSKLKKYNSTIEASLFSDNVSTDIYDNYVDVINEKLPTLHKYYDLRKEVLNISKIHLYDMYANLVEGFNKKYSYEEAQNIVKDSLSILGDDYIKILDTMFKERWIDVYNNVGKSSGACSLLVYDGKPYILLNYEGEIGSVSTLAHEIGHSVHTYYSVENQNYYNSQYKIFIAEIASTVNELLLSKHILSNSNNNAEKLYILNNLMENFTSTIYRQIMFAEFERTTHKKHEEGVILTSEVLNEDWYKLNQKYFGKSVIVDDDIKYEWSRIPHFYTPFYVYKYAIGLSCACFIVDDITSGKDGALENYKNLLKAGNSDYPVNILKNVGIDITKKDVIYSAINMFDETIEEFKKLVRK